MDFTLLNKITPVSWQIDQKGRMNVPAVIYGSEQLIKGMDHKVYEQICNVASLPGIVGKAYAMPDAHWGYGFPIGGVAAFDAKSGGIISAGGVGFDISCGVRLLHTGLKIKDIDSKKEILANQLYKKIPSGVGSESALFLSDHEIDEMLTKGARWAIEQGYGEQTDLEFMEENGFMPNANPDKISSHAKRRQKPEMGTLGSGNHYLEVQEVKEICYPEAAKSFGLELGDVVISIHCGSRGLGHQIGTDYLRLMIKNMTNYGIKISDRELACAPINSDLGQNYLEAMRGGINCAFANRQILSHFLRKEFKTLFPETSLKLIYDVSHNTCKLETHMIEGKQKQLYVHRKGATRAFGPESHDLPQKYKKVGQPVFIGGSMGTGSYVLVGTKENAELSFSSACHGAGRAMSRTEAHGLWSGPQIINELHKKGILIRSGSFRGIAEEAPLAYKNLQEVAESAEVAKLARKVCLLSPHICVKG